MDNDHHLLVRRQRCGEIRASSDWARCVLGRQVVIKERRTETAQGLIWLTLMYLLPPLKSCKKRGFVVNLCFCSGRIERLIKFPHFGLETHSPKLYITEYPQAGLPRKRHALLTEHCPNQLSVPARKVSRKNYRKPIVYYTHFEVSLRMLSSSTLVAHQG